MTLAKNARCVTHTGWNYTVRPYRPRSEILDDKWAFPKPVAVQ